MNFNRALNKEQILVSMEFLCCLCFYPILDNMKRCHGMGYYWQLDNSWLHHSCSIRDMALWNKLKKRYCVY